MKNKRELARYLWELFGVEQNLEIDDFLKALVTFEEETEEQDVPSTKNEVNSPHPSYRIASATSEKIDGDINSQLTKEIQKGFVKGKKEVAE